MIHRPPMPLRISVVKGTGLAGSETYESEVPGSEAAGAVKASPPLPRRYMSRVEACLGGQALKRRHRLAPVLNASTLGISNDPSPLSVMRKNGSMTCSRKNCPVF